MRKILLALVAAATALTVASPALAREGCGRNFHRGPYGRCLPNRGPAYVTPGPTVRLVIGRNYPGRGYWDGHRYYQNRYRHHGGWRYR
jgi:hypothetical protein